MVQSIAVSSAGSANRDPFRVFLDQHATSYRLLFESEDVQATLHTLRDGTQLVLKVTSADRADFEWVQLANEVKAAKSVPHSSSLGQQLAWQEAADGRALSVSIYAGPTVEALLQEPAARGGWADLQLWQRVEVVRDLLAGGVHALIRMRPWLHFDVKPANVAVLPCPGGGPPHITLLDMGAATHIAALHTPQRSSLYPVVSMEHMDVALITLQPGEVQLPYETKQGCRDALSLTTDVFTLGLLAYKVLLGPSLPPEMDWDSTMYQPGGTQQEQLYVSEQQRLARDLAAGISSHPGTRTLLQQLPQDCLQVLGRMCDPNPASRAQLQEVAGMGFIQQRLQQLGVYSAARDAAYAAAKQGIINLLQEVPGIQLAAHPSSRVKEQPVSHSSSTADVPTNAASQTSSSSNFNSSRNYNHSHDSKNSNSNACLEHTEAGGLRPPGFFARLPRGTNAAREAAAAALAAVAGRAASQSNQAKQQHQPNHQQQQQGYPSGAYEDSHHATSGQFGYQASGNYSSCIAAHSNGAAAMQVQQHVHPSGACQPPQSAAFGQFGYQAGSYDSNAASAAVVMQRNSRVGQQQQHGLVSSSIAVYTSKPKQQQHLPAGQQGSAAPLGFGQQPALSTALDGWGPTSSTANGWGGTADRQLNNSRPQQQQQQQQAQHEDWDEPPGSLGPPGFAHRQQKEQQQQHEGWGMAPYFPGPGGFAHTQQTQQQQDEGWDMAPYCSGTRGVAHRQHKQQQQHEGWGTTPYSADPAFAPRQHEEQQQQQGGEWRVSDASSPPGFPPRQDEQQQHGWATAPHSSRPRGVADRQQQQQHKQEGWGDVPDSGPPELGYRQHEQQQQQGGEVAPCAPDLPGFPHKQHEQQAGWGTAPESSRATVHTDRQQQWQQQQQQHERWDMAPYASRASVHTDRQQQQQQQQHKGWDMAPYSFKARGYSAKQQQQQQQQHEGWGTALHPSKTHVHTGRQQQRQRQQQQHEGCSTAPYSSMPLVHTLAQQQQQQHEGWISPPDSPGPPGFAQKQHRPSDDGRVLRDQQWQQAAEDCPPGFGMSVGRRHSQAGNAQLQHQQQGKVQVHDDSHWQQGSWQQCGSAAAGVAPSAWARAQLPGTSGVTDGGGWVSQQLQQAVLCAAVGGTGSQLAAAKQAVLSDFW